MRVQVLAWLAVASTTAFAETKTSAPAPEGTDFTAQVKTMFRVAACGSDDELPARMGKRTVDAHCSDMKELYKDFHRSWIDKAKPFIAKLRPTDLTTTVVYPFGGGDLSSALTVFPDATEVTTISLEAAGDIRTIDTIKKDQLEKDLATTTKSIHRLYSSAYSATQNLMVASHAELPGTIMFALAGLAVHDMEPLQLRYFDLDADGNVHYLTTEEMDAREKDIDAHRKKKHSRHFWYEQTSAFANVEIMFRPRGDTKAAPRVYRHILANLDNTHLGADERLLKHLRQKGGVAVMTKAASFLLWWPDFSQIRDHLLSHTAWMISDASGIPPRFADPAGFEQETFGDFAGPYFTQDPIDARTELIKLWKDQPHRDLPFRFGYPDKEKHNHLMVMRPKGHGDQ